MKLLKNLLKFKSKLQTEDQFHGFVRKTRYVIIAVLPLIISSNIKRSGDPCSPDNNMLVHSNNMATVYKPPSKTFLSDFSFLDNAFKEFRYCHTISYNTVIYGTPKI